MLRLKIYLFAISIILASCQLSKENSSVKKLVEPVASLYDSALKPFYHGVASGDPLKDRVIIWTRITPEDSVQRISVTWELSETEAFNTVFKSDTTSTTAIRDYTVKADVNGLSPGKYYYYRFTALGKTSSVGRTKTLPETADSLKLAVVSCSNWEFGYFNAYSRIADKEVDAVLHLGDYIYEYAQGGYGNKNVDRKHLPPHEIVTLQDYRTRYSQYHLDAGLREARRKHPFITIWDDHEVANNVYKSGAQNHQPDKEGDFEARKNAARQSYYEWIPIRENDKHYRAFSFGKLATLVMLDERLEGRVKQLDSLSDPALFNEDRTMLGTAQFQWLESQLKEADATWKVIGNQVIFSDLDESLNKAGHQRNLDSWDGYPAEKKRFASFIQQGKIRDIIFLTGDTHASWAFDVITNLEKTYPNKTAQDAFAVELGVTSISSSNSNEYAPDDSVMIKEAALLKANTHLKFTNHRDHGYLLLSLFPQQAVAEWYYVETLLQPDKRERLGKRLTVKQGHSSLK